MKLFTEALAAIIMGGCFLFLGFVIGNAVGYKRGAQDVKEN